MAGENQPPIDPEKVYELVDTDGNVAYRTGANLDKALAMGMRLRTTAEEAAAFKAEGEEAIYSTPEQKAKALIGSAASGASFGGTDALQRLADSDEEWQETKLGRQHNPGYAAAGSIAGAVLPAIASGGAGALGAAARLTPAGAASRVGTALAKAAPGASAGAQIARAGVGFGVEGALHGLGQGAQELINADDPVTIERAVSVLSSNALYGGLISGFVGAGARAAGIGLGKARKVVEEGAAKAKASPVGVDDLSTLDAKGLRVAKDAEVEALVTKQATERVAAADEVLAYAADDSSQAVWLAAAEGTRDGLRKSKAAIRALGVDVVGLQKNPTPLLRPLRMEAQTIRSTLAKADETLAALAAEDTDLAATLAKRVAAATNDVVPLDGKLASRFRDFAGKKIGKTGTVSRADAEELVGAIQRGEVQGARRTAHESLAKRLQQNEALQARIEASLVPKTELASERLTQIQEASEALTAGGRKGRGLGEQLLQGAVFSGVTGVVAPLLPDQLQPLAAIVGGVAAGKVTGLAFGRLAKAGAEQAARTVAAVDAIMTAGAKVGRPVPVLASKVLGQVAFAEPAAPKPAARAVAQAETKNPGLPEVYKKREAELLSQVTAAPDGRVVMRPEARRKVADRLAALGMVSPLLADQMETIAARRIEFLASKLPKQPDLGVMQIGPSNWRPSDMDMRKFARYVAAVEDPGAVEERLAEGTVTPEDAEAYATVYPERMADLKRQIVERLPELQEALPFKRRVALSIFTGIPVDPAMRPAMLRRLQAQFGAEAGTEGGMQAPMATPQGGSVARGESDLTPAQSRAAG